MSCRAVQPIPGGGHIETVWKHFQTNGLGYLFAIAVTTLAAMMSVWIGPSSVMLLQVLAVLIGSWSGGLYPGLLATALCLLTDSYYYFEPFGEFGIEKLSDHRSASLFLVVGVSIAVVNELKRRAFREEDRRRDELQTLMACIGEGVIATNLEGLVVSLNPVAEKLTGWTMREALGKPLTLVFRSREDSGPKLPSLEGPAKPPKSREFGQISTFLLSSRKGTETHIETTATPMRDAQGNPLGTVIVFRDVSDRLKGEVLQRENEDRFRALIRATAEVVWTTNAQGLIVQDSPTWREFTGQTYEEFIHEGWLNALHPDDRKPASIAWAEAIRNRSMYQVEYRIKSASGDYRWTSVRGVPVLNEDGTIREWIGMNADITKEHLARETLRASEQRYQLVAEAANDIIWDWDLQTDHVDWNIGLHRLLGYPRQTMQTDAQWWYERIHQEDRKRIESLIHTVMHRGPDRWSAEYRFARADGTYAFVLDRGRVVRDNGKPVRMVGSMLDLTDRKRIEQTMAERSRLADLRADVSECLSKPDTLENTLLECTKAITRRLQACGARIWLVDEQTRELKMLRPNDGADACDTAPDSANGIADPGAENTTPCDLLTADYFPIAQIAGQMQMSSSQSVLTEYLSQFAPETLNPAVTSFVGYPLIVDGKAVGVLAVFCEQDIPDLTQKDLAPLANTIAQFIERKQGEIKLQEQGEQYRSIFEASNDAIMIFNTAGELVEANPHACEMHGYEYEEFIGKSGPEILQASDRELPRFHRFHERVRKGESFFDSGIHLKKDGTPIMVEVQGSALQYRGQQHLLAVVRDVTERRRAEQQFLELTHESERQRRLYETVLSNSLDQVYVFDLSHRFTYANQALLNTWGKTWDEAIGKNCKELNYSDDQVARFTQELNHVIVTKRPYRGEIPYIGTNGRRIYDYIFYPVLGVNGEVEAVAGTSRDVTDRKITENNLRQSEGRFRQLADAMPQIVWTATPNGYIDYYNNRWYEFTGFEQDSRGDNCWELILHPDDYERWRVSWETSVETGALCEIEFRMYDRHAISYQWYLGRAEAVKDEYGDVIRWFGTCTNINRQKRNEQISDFLGDVSSRLVEMISDDRAIQEVARIAVPDFADWCTIDLLEADGRSRRAALVSTEVDQSDLAERLGEIYPAQFEANLILWKTFETGATQLIPRIEDSELIPSSQKSAMMHEQQHPWLRSCLCVPLISRGQMLGAMTYAMSDSSRYFDSEDMQAAEDVASRFTVALENSKLYDQLRDSDRRKDEFLAMLAHELRNPLAPIRSGLDLFTLEGGPHQPVLLVMKEQVEHLVRLVDDLLDVSRIMRGKIDLRRSVIDLRDLVERGMEATQWLFDEKSQTLTVKLPETPLWVNADPVRLVQVVSNLLNNASKYTDQGGKIELQVETQQDQLFLRVTDNGIGIEAELLPSVFDLFTQSSRALDRAQGGLGIGLTLVRNLVEMHEGKVSVFSDGPGLGSEFLVQLPLAPQPHQAEVIENHLPQAGPQKILVVDDNLGAARLLSLLLAKLDAHEIRTAHDGPSALQLLQDYHPDLILLDIGLPEMDGYEVASRIRKLPGFEQTLLVALTGYGREEDRLQSKAAGFDEHLVKPPALDMLRQVLQHPRLHREEESVAAPLAPATADSPPEETSAPSDTDFTSDSTLEFIDPAVLAAGVAKADALAEKEAEANQAEVKKEAEGEAPAEPDEQSTPAPASPTEPDPVQDPPV